MVLDFSLELLMVFITKYPVMPRMMLVIKIVASNSNKENPFSYDFLITVEDNGKYTNDGIVSGGNKIKVGLKVTLEAPLYRLDGVITNIKVLSYKNNENE